MAEARRRSRSPRRKTRFSDVDPNREEQEMIQSLETVKNAQTTKVDRKLYVGNLPPGITQAQLVELLNSTIINRKFNAYPGNPVMSAWISGDGNYAFVEFRSIEEANNAISLNNYPILGQNLKVSRPKTYAGLQPASSSDRNTLMGGYTLPSVSAYASLTEVSKQGPLKPLRVNLSSQVICLNQILSQDVVKDDNALQDLQREIRDFCEQFEDILEIFIPQEGPLAGNVYLETLSCGCAKNLVRVLSKKTWKGNPLKMSYVDWLAFKEKRIDEAQKLEVFLYK